VAEPAEVYREYAAAHNLDLIGSVAVEPLTPLLLEGVGGELAPVVRGNLPGGINGVLAQLSYTRNATFRFSVALTEVAQSQAFAPRLFCVRKKRRTRDDEFYGFEARDSKLWTESVALSERFTVSTSPFQDPNWLRQLFSPLFIDWLSTEPPADFSFELAYGALLGSIEMDRPGIAELDALCAATAHVAERIKQECAE
jgi:hypothetical protein